MRVVVADDHPMYRFGLLTALGHSREVEVVGEAGDGRQLLAVVERTEPDVVLTDLAMPALDGVGAIAALLAARPQLGIVVLSMHEDDERLFGALRAGARGYLLKGADREEIVRAVLAAADGGAVYAAAVARRISSFFTDAHQSYAAQVFPELSTREREVLELIASGRRNLQIAQQLVLSEKTVRNHVSSIMAKLGVHDRGELVATARNAGLGTSPR
ncbi:response regulator transcription factor [Kineococcus aurantiacus]